MRKLESIRKYLHQNPELSGEERDTQRYLRAHLEELDCGEIVEVGGTGLLAVFDSGKPGKSILFRGDIDALPIQERNSFSHKSRVEGVSHKCGHDGHTTVMLGLARHFSKNPPKKGRLSILFQPAEETGNGARAVLKDPNFKEKHFDEAYAFHNLPGLPMGEVVCRKGTFSAGAISVAYTLKGKTSHAGEPEKGLNPSPAVADVLIEAEELSQPDFHRDDFAYITPVYLKMGLPAYGTSPGEAEAHFTLRSWGDSELSALQEKFDEAIKEICRERGLNVESTSFEEFRPNVNTDKGFEQVKRAAENEGYPFREIEEPFRWGEDFGLFTQNFPGAMFGIGAGEDTPALHCSNYDFPDAILESTVKVFVNLAHQTLAD